MLPLSHDSLAAPVVGEFMFKMPTLRSGLRWMVGCMLAQAFLIGCAASTPMASTDVTSAVPLDAELTETLSPTMPSTLDPLTQPVTYAPTIQPTDPPTELTQAPLPTGDPETTIIPPRFGTFDVYISAPDEDGSQSVQWIDSVAGVAVTQVKITAVDQEAVRAGQFVYFVDAATNRLMRINTGGYVQSLGFASPPVDAAFYDYALSATGNYLAWSVVKQNGDYSISVSDIEGAQPRVILSGTSAAGDQVQLLRVTNSGEKVFYDHLPATITRRTLFRGLYSLSVVDTTSGQSVLLPNEPACGEIFVCDAHVSPDGAFLIRTLPPTRFRQPIVVTNLVTSVILRQFAPPEADTVFPVDIGYPFFTPGGEMVYVEAYGPTSLESYRLIWANIVTGEQRIIAELGNDPHRPLGWVANGTKLLTTREKGWYDTWQVDIVTGDMRQIAGLMFLGHVEEPPRQP